MWNIGYLMFVWIFEFFLFCTLPLFVMRRNYEPIRSRGWEFVVCSAISGAIYFAFTGMAAASETGVNCHWIIWPVAIFIPSWAYPAFFRAYLLYATLKKQSGLQVQASNSEDPESKPRPKRFITSKRLLLGLYAFVVVLFLVVFIIIMATKPLPASTDFDCFPGTIYFIGAQALLALIAMVIFLILLWNSKDVYLFKYELKLLIFFSIPIFVFWVIYRITSLLPRTVNPDFLVWLIITAFYILSVIYPLYLSYGNRWFGTIKAMKPSNSIGSMGSSNSTGKVTVDDMLTIVLATPILHDAFTNFCQELWCIENVVFVDEVLQYKNLSASNRLAKAIFVSKMYLLDSAPYQINIDGSSRNKVLQAIKLEQTPENLFDDLHKMVFEQMRSDTFEKWRKLPTFGDLWKRHGVMKSGKSSRVFHETEPESHEVVMDEMRTQKSDTLLTDDF